MCNTHPCYSMSVLLRAGPEIVKTNVAIEDVGLFLVSLLLLFLQLLVKRMEV